MSCDLYRLYDAEDQLLYIGISWSAIARMSQHKAEKPWFGDVARIEVTKCSSRAEATNLERQAIQAERPLHNKQHTVSSKPGFKVKSSTSRPAGSQGNLRLVIDHLKLCAIARELALRAIHRGLVDYGSLSDDDFFQWIFWSPSAISIRLREITDYLEANRPSNVVHFANSEREHLVEQTMLCLRYHRFIEKNEDDRWVATISMLTKDIAQIIEISDGPNMENYA